MFLSRLNFSNRQTRQRKQKSKAIIEDSDDDMEQVVIVTPHERSIQASMHAPNASVSFVVSLNICPVVN